MYTHEVGAKQVRYYWLRHARGVNVGPFNQQSGIKGESAVDIDAELDVLNKKLSQTLNIQAENLTGKISKSQLDSALTGELVGIQSATSNASAQINAINKNNEIFSTDIRQKISALELSSRNIDVGGRNYLLRSSGTATAWNVSPDAKENWRGKKLTLSVYLNAKGIVRGGRNRIGLSMFLYYMDNSYTWIECWLSNHQGDYSGRLKSTIQLLDKPIKSISNCSFKVEVGGGTCVATNPKLEIGNVATDWSPAPEDLTTVIQFEDIKRSLSNESNARVAWENSANSRIGNAEATINQLGGTKSNKDEVATIAAQALRSQWQSDAKAKVDEVSRAISSETSARTEWQRSAESKINRVDGFSARIDEINRTVTDVSGKVSATHTIKTQAIAGGKTAIAGITLGSSSSGRDVESSVIVMADRFQVVKNASDSSPKPILRVENGQTVLNGDLIADGDITARKLATGSVMTNHLTVGSVAAKHIASKTINAEHIESKSITAKELNVESLSAISADLGAITGGSLKIGSLNGNFGTLFEVQSNGGFRLISRDASGGIELSSATRALHVWEGGTESVRVGKLS